MHDVFVAGGTGTAGLAFVHELVERGYGTIATARSADGAERLAQAGATAVAVDLTDAATIAEAIRGCTAVVVAVLGRGEDPVQAEAEVTRNVIDAAAALGVGRIIYTSVHTADRSTGVPHFEVKGNLERYLASADIQSTVLRPCTFMEALTAPWIMQGVVARGVLASPIALDTPISYIAAADVAAIGVDALGRTDADGETLVLGGPEAVTYRDLLPLLAELTGREVTHEQIPLSAVSSQFGADMAAMIRLFNEEGFVARPDLGAGRSLTRVEAFLRRAFALVS